MARFVGFPSLGICAVIKDASGGGSATDPGAPRNAPAIDPDSHPDKVLFHTDWDFYRVYMSGQTTINHAAVAGVAGTPPEPPIDGLLTNVEIVITGQLTTLTHTLVTHGLGYVPKFFVAYNGMMIPHGTVIQREDAERARLVCAYATTSIIGLKEVAYSSASSLPSASRTYQYIVFEQVEQDPDLPLFSGGPEYVQLGRGMVDSSKRTLRVTGSGDTPFSIALGPTAGYGNGGIRVYTPDGTPLDYGPYSGSFSAPAAINVGV